MKEIKHTLGGERKLYQVSVDGIEIKKRKGFRKAGYNEKILQTKTEDTEVVGDLSQIPRNERHSVGTKKGIKMASFQSEEQRDSGHQTTIEERKGKDMEDDYCNTNDIPQ